MAAVPAMTVAVACVPLFKDHAKPCGWALKRPSLQQAFEGAWPGPESVTRGVRFGPLSDRGSTDVSIHAPAWGATVFASKMIVRPMFRSALPRGERHTKIKPPQISKLVFRSALPVGSDETGCCD